MATHSSILAWRIPWTEEPGGLQLMGSQTLSSCSVRASHCVGFSCGAWDLGARTYVTAAHGLSNCGSQALENIGS